MEAVDLRECTLKKVRIEGNVIGKYGTFEIEQIFKNEKRNLLEVGYTFPIAETATVIGFEVNVEGTDSRVQYLSKTKKVKIRVVEK